MTGMHIHVFGDHPFTRHVSRTCPRARPCPDSTHSSDGRPSCVMHITFHMGKRNHGAAIFYKVFTLDVKSCNDLTDLPNASLASGVGRAVTNWPLLAGGTRYR
jgi:hypothetical protein